MAPWLARALGWLVLRPTPAAADRLGGLLIRLDLAPLVLGLVSVPAIMWTSGFFGWSLGLASAIGRGFPDFLLHLEPDMPFYLAYFLAGWWLHRQRASLPDVARYWLPSLLVGLATHAAATAVSGAYAFQTSLPGYGLIRIGGYALYAVGSAYTAFGFLGLFQRFIDRPTRAGRYLADTAFWVYLVHQPLLAPLLKWIVPLGLPWWLQGHVVAGLGTASVLVLYEAIVRPTPLVRLFGSGQREPVGSCSVPGTERDGSSGERARVYRGGNGDRAGLRLGVSPGMSCAVS